MNKKSRFYLLDGAYLFDKSANFIEGATTGKIYLSINEARIVYMLISNSGTCVKRSDLIQHSWKNKIVVDNSLNVAIANIRRKLRLHSILSEHLMTVSGEGYQWVGIVNPIDNNIFNENSPSNSSIESIQVPTEYLYFYILKGSFLIVALLILSFSLIFFLSITNII